MIRTAQKKIKFLLGLINGESAYTGPFYIDVDITRFCNLNCYGCQYHSSKTRKSKRQDLSVDHISLELINRICTELPGLNTYEVFLCGQGEPLLHPKIENIITAFKKTRSKVHLFTNGTLIDDNRAHMFINSNLDVLRVSLWAVSCEEYKKCYPGTDPANLQKTLEGIKLIQKLKHQAGVKLPKIILTTPLNRSNYTSIETRIRLAHELGCDGLWFDIYHHWGEFSQEALSPEESARLCRKLKKMKPVIKSFYMTDNISEFLARYRMGEKVWLRNPCYAGWFHARIQVDGRILPCGSCQVPLGDLNNNSLSEIWDSSEFRMFRKTAFHINADMVGRYECDCDWCCLGQSNYKVHRIFKWILPFLKKRESRYRKKPW